MGNFGYICLGCNKSIRGDEKAVMKHIRHGEVLGETVGTYDGYGRVYEDENFRNNSDGINGHMSIIESEFDLEDSVGTDKKVYKGENVSWMEYRSVKVKEGVKDLSDEIYEEWDKLKRYVPTEISSGVEAWHKYCYERATEEEKNKHIISESDPDQSWGNPRKKFM